MGKQLAFHRSGGTEVAKTSTIPPAKGIEVRHKHFALSSIDC